MITGNIGVQLTTDVSMEFIYEVFEHLVCMRVNDNIIIVSRFGVQTWE